MTPRQPTAAGPLRRVLALEFRGRTWDVDVAGKPFDADVLMRRFRRAAEILEGADTGGQARNL